MKGKKTRMKGRNNKRKAWGQQRAQRGWRWKASKKWKRNKRGKIRTAAIMELLTLLFCIRYPLSLCLCLSFFILSCVFSSQSDSRFCTHLTPNTKFLTFVSWRLSNKLETTWDRFPDSCSDFSGKQNYKELELQSVAWFKFSAKYREKN